MSITGPARIGRYELISRLAAGGMGELFLARVRGSGLDFEKRVVIKRILPHLAADPAFVERFIAEGKLVVQLSHASIAQVLDMGQEGGVAFIAMEYIDGRDLAELMRLARLSDVMPSRAMVVSLLCRLLEALDYAHTAKGRDGAPLEVIHRDISPANVMVSRSGEVKLVDFGIARATERLHATTTGAIRGKYSYMSPQQAAGLELDTRSDLFSFGVLAWELLAGSRPFDGANDILTLDQIRFFDPPRLSEVADVPPELGDAVDTLLAKDPDDRFQSAGEALRVFQAYLAQTGEVVLARDVAGWVGRVLDTLPAGLQDRPTAGLSLDDALRLGLATPAPAHHTAAFATTALAEPGETPSAVPAPLPSTGHTSPAAATVPGRSPRSPMLVALLVVNLILIGAVAVFVFGDDGEPARAGDAPTPEPIAHATSAPELPSLADTHTALKAPDAVVIAAATVATDPAPDPVIAADAVQEVVAGSVAGGRVADALARITATVDTTVRATPAHARIAIEGRSGRKNPWRLTTRRGDVLRGRVTAKGHHDRRFTHIAGADGPTAFIALEAIETGWVTFRYRPATADVLIDGKMIAVPSNPPRIALPIGEHRVTIRDAAGRKVTRRFKVAAGEETNLYTLRTADDE